MSVDSRVSIRERTPKVALKARHLEGGAILPSRLEMLDILPNSMKCLELGVANGGFSKEILDRMKPLKLDLVDLWGSKRYEDGLEYVHEIFSNYIEEGTVQTHRCKSIDFLKSNLVNKFDFIYIDTDHTFQTTYDELVLSSQLINEKGYIAGHDYCVGNIVTPVVYGVIEAVNKFCVECDFRILYITAEPAGWNSFCLTKI